MRIEPRIVEIRPGGPGRPDSKRPFPPADLAGKRLVMTELVGPSRLCAVQLEDVDDSEDAMGPFDADAFQVCYPPERKR